MKKQFLLGLMAMVLPLATWAEVTVNVAKNEAGTVTYNGTATLPAITVTDTKEDGTVKTLQTPSEYVLSYFLVTGEGEDVTETPISAAQVYNVGKYKVVALGMSNDYVGQIGSATFEVTPMVINKLVLSEGEFHRYYDGTTDDNITSEQLSAIVSAEKYAEGVVATEKAEFIKCLTVKRTQETKDVKDANQKALVEVVANPAAKSNYVYVYESGRTVNVELVIDPLPLTVTLYPSSYTNSVKNINNLNKRSCKEWSAQPEAFTGVLPEDMNNFDIKFTYAGEGEIKNVGNYDLTATPTNENYTVEGTVTYSVTKATLTVSKANDQPLEKTYGANDPVWKKEFVFTPSYSTTPLTDAEFDEIVTITREGDENVKYGTDGKTPAGYDINIALKEAAANNFTLKNFDKKPQLTINPLKLNKGEDKEGGVASDNIKFDEPRKAITYAGVDFVATKPAIDGLTLTTKGLEIATLNDVVLEKDKDYTLVYGVTDQADKKADEAGEKFNISIMGKGNYSGGLWSLGYVIEKAPLAISEKEGAVFKRIGKVKPDWTELFDFDEFVGKDIADPSDVLDQFYVSTSGMIKIHTENIKNYEVVEYTPVPMLTLEDNFTLYGDNYATVKGKEENAEIDFTNHNTKVLTDYAGLTVDNVTIENLRGLRTKQFTYGKYYSLVLPFEIDVRELSQQLGYAVVTIPNTNNTDPETIKFGLTITKVPANTMMLFRVDGLGIEDNESLEDISLTFEQKEIVKDLNPNPDFAKDKAGHNFMITYEEKALEEENEYYWAPSGVLNSATDYMEIYKEAIKVNAFNGYFVFEKNSEARSIEIEGADGSITAINLVTGETTNYGAEGWYTVGGVKLNAQPTQKGIYINNGKKVVIK